MENNIINKLNTLLLESEEFNKEFIPLKETLLPIQQDVKDALNSLREKSENSKETSDKIFYLNRYADLIKKIESIFDTRSRRLQSILQTISKIPAENLKDEIKEVKEQIETNQDNLSPEQCNEILKILHNSGGEREND